MVRPDTITDGSVVTIAAQTDGVEAPSGESDPPADPTPHLADIVYVVRPGEVNEELRYSLRSLRNLPHGKVWIAGYCPSWVTGVGKIPVSRAPGAHATTKANLRAACLHPDVAEEFVYFNDDFFVMQPQETMPAMHRGTLDHAIKSGMSRSYTRAMRATQVILIEQGIEEPLCYELHAPTRVTKTGMLKALDLCSYPMVQERSVYGNLAQLGGEPARNFKVYHGDYGWKAWPFLSTNDSSFQRQPVGDYIRASFPSRSPYETDTPPLLRGTPHRVRPVRRPIRYSNVSRIGRVSAGVRG